MNTPCPDHTLTHLRDALAQDGRVGELGLDVRRLQRDGRDEVIISGSVSTAERKAHVLEVAREVLRAGGYECGLVDDTTVARPIRPDPDDVETL